ncbi:MAG: hypothetical protein DHS20C18_07800 [Saprospiraceae bacterium]|nr:MAG: hypothetical protein DHS20C18_07800 [Saprospiraceae bacterium]
MKNVICDLHVHSGLKGFGAHGHEEFNKRSIWDKFPERADVMKRLNFFLKAAIKDVAKESQANLDACAETKLMVPFLAIYPIERQMFEMDPQRPYKNLFNLFLQGKQPVFLGSAVSGFPPEKVADILANFEKGNDDGVDYFKNYLEERNYLMDQTMVGSKHNDFSFKIATNYKNFQALLASKTTITGILTVEGVHSFGHYLNNSTFKKTFDQLDTIERTVLEQSFIENITRVKKERKGELAPFFVTFCHHFNNLLAGHARSFSGKSDFLSGFAWPNKPGMRHLLNQETNLKKGFSTLGKQVMELMLDRSKGKRILIDTKHMSLASRWEYYQYIKHKREVEGDNIPIVHSHGAISGWKTLGDAAKHEEDEKIDKNQFFSRWQINLTDEDILETYDSAGIIGLLLHEGRMPGESFKKEANKLKKKIKNAKRNQAKRDFYSVQLKDLYIKLLWSNIFHIVKTVQEERGEDGWGLITFGSDFDGLIDPFDSYAEATGFKDLREDMIQYLKSGKEVLISENGTEKTLPGEEVWSLMAGKTPEERMQQIMFSNADRFLSRYFTDDYLNNLLTLNDAHSTMNS